MVGEGGAPPLQREAGAPPPLRPEHPAMVHPPWVGPSRAGPLWSAHRRRGSYMQEKHHGHTVHLAMVARWRQEGRRRSALEMCG